MFYRPGIDEHGLRGNPFNQLVVPRPIGWISSLDRDGRVNLAPFSFFNAVAYVPPQVMFSTTGPHAEGGAKDSLANVRETGEFVFNLATWPLREAVNLTSAPAPRHVDELELAGLTAAPGRLVAPPLVAESPVQLECTLVDVVELRTPDRDEHTNTVVFGEVVGVHIADEAVVEGSVDVLRLDPIARLGYDQYTRVTEIFRMTRPGWPIDPSRDEPASPGQP
jgi:flavin reductase (DIM6/NTAB) family NADH-FMN oxidoreductase RutF